MREATANLPISIVGIGASAGGLEAIREMLSTAPKDCPMAFVIVQHLDPHHESMLAELVGRATSLKVRQIAGDECVEPGNVYIIPPGFGLGIEGTRLVLKDFAQPRGLRRPIDDFFDELGREQGENAACVILSGTGADGTSGLRAIKEYGGLCVVQEPETARYDGMPLSAMGTGLVDLICPVEDIVPALMSYFARRSDEKDQAIDQIGEHVEDLCATLRNAIGHDFSGYKRSTLIRRIERRMHVLAQESPRAYLAHLHENATECEALFRDLLINVTRFFRDTEFFAILEKQAIVPLVEEAAHNDEIRVWVPGCSSGEEAYSIAMLFASAVDRADKRLLVQIFATDIDDQMLTLAREGRYPAAALSDIPLEMRQKYLIAGEDSFEIAPQIRDMIRFSNHSVLKDPPFSKISLLSCRNLLIYFDDKLQSAVIPIFHYALRTDGFLFLGPSESLGRADHMFRAIDQKARLFQRIAGRPLYPLALPANVERVRSARQPIDQYPAAKRLSWEDNLSLRRLAEQYAPASMVVDAEGEIISSNGRLAKYFEFPSGGKGPTFATTVARPGLREVLPALIRQSSETAKRSIVRNLTVVSEFGEQKLEVISDPLSDGSVLLVFRELERFQASDEADMIEVDQTDDRMTLLEDELRLTRHRLRTAVEELETANEELKSSNEEMMSMNEELQSTNEELSTVNDELKSKVDQLTTANTDLRNFFDSTQIAVVVVDKDLLIRSFTRSATDIFPLQETDRGRPLGDVASHFDDPEYLRQARLVAGGEPAVSRRIRSRSRERTWIMRIIPYRNGNGAIDGSILVFTDVSEETRLADALLQQRQRLELAIQVAGVGIWEYRRDDDLLMSGRLHSDLFGFAPFGSGSLEKFLEPISEPDRRQIRSMFENASTGQTFEATLGLARDEIDTTWLRLIGRLVQSDDGDHVLAVTTDVTAERRIRETRELMIREMNHRVKNLFAVISSIITASVRECEDAPSLAENVRNKIRVLSDAHGLTYVNNEPMALDLTFLINTILAPFRGASDIHIQGPNVLIRPDHVTPLGLMIGEWATNAVKYGVLGHRPGTLEIRWSMLGDELVLSWSEQSETPIDRSSHQTGFGSRLTAASVRHLDGKLSLDMKDKTYFITLKFKP